MNPAGHGKDEISAGDVGVLGACGLVYWGCVIGRPGAGMVGACPGMDGTPGVAGVGDVALCCAKAIGAPSSSVNTATSTSATVERPGHPHAVRRMGSSFLQIRSSKFEIRISRGVSQRSVAASRKISGL
jgi:hypothetical protein